MRVLFFFFQLSVPEPGPESGTGCIVLSSGWGRINQALGLESWEKGSPRSRKTTTRLQVGGSQFRSPSLPREKEDSGDYAYAFWEHLLTPSSLLYFVSLSTWPLSLSHLSTITSHRLTPFLFIFPSLGVLCLVKNNKKNTHGWPKRAILLILTFSRETQSI